jgi:hypothetical protein
MLKEMAAHEFDEYHEICLEGQRKANKILSGNSVCVPTYEPTPIIIQVKYVTVSSNLAC